MTFSIQTIINEAVRPTEERKKERWWATDLGKCLRGAYYARLGDAEKSELDDRTYRVFKAGQVFEQFVVDTLKSKVSDYEFTQPETIYMKEHDLSCRPDLIVKHKETGKQYVYELKTVHSDKFWYMEKNGGKPDEHYLMQAWCECLVTGIEDGRLLYVSKDDLCIAEYQVSLHDVALGNAVKNELNILNHCWKTKTLPPRAEPIKDGKINWKAKYCNYHHLCMGNLDWLKVAEEELKASKKKKGWRKV